MNKKVEMFFLDLLTGIIGLGFGIIVPFMISFMIQMASTEMPLEQQVAREFLPLFVSSILTSVCLGFTIQIYKEIPPVAMFFVGFNAAFIWWLYMAAQSPDGNGTMYELLLTVHLVLAGLLLVMTLASKLKFVIGKARPGLVTDDKD